MSRLPTLGVDPGAVEGAAVLIDPTGSAALGAWAWRRCTRDGRHSYTLRDSDRPTQTLRTLHACGVAIAARVRSLTDLGPFLLVEEQLFSVPGRSHITLEILADARAELCGPLRYLSREWGDPVRVHPSRWRPDVLGRGAGRLHAKAAGDLALRMVPRLVSGMGDLHLIEHACEAAAMARWGARVHQAPTPASLGLGVM